MKPDESKQKDSDMDNVLAALVRASRRARKLAQQTRTEFVVVRDGRLVREIPPAYDDEINETGQNA